MSVLDTSLKANQTYAASFGDNSLPMPPAKQFAVLACMDARLMPDQFLGFGIGDAHVIRNAGGLATDDAIRSLVISYKLLGTREFFVVNHSDCGMLTFEEDAVKAQLAKDTGADTGPLRLYPFKNLEENVRVQVGKIRSCPWIPNDTPVYGFIYQVEDGRLRQIV